MASAAILGGGGAARFGRRDQNLIAMPVAACNLLAHTVELAANTDIVVPLTERGYHPVCAVYTRASAAAVALRPIRGERQMVGLLEDVRVKVAEKRDLERFGDTAQLLANVNTPAEFDELESLLGHKPQS